MENDHGEYYPGVDPVTKESGSDGGDEQNVYKDIVEMLEETQEDVLLFGLRNPVRSEFVQALACFLFG